MHFVGLRHPGRVAVAFLAACGRTAWFGVAASLGALTSRDGIAASSVQALVLLARCAGPIALVVAPIGAMLALQSFTFMRAFGVERSLAPLVVATLVREIAPGFCAVVVAMQGGAGIAAELGAMRERDELDALAVMGLDPRALVAGPRIVGATLAVPLLNGLAVVCGVAGSYAMAVLWLGLGRATFVQTMGDAIGVIDLWVSEGKSLLFGMVIGFICSNAGFSAARGPAGVGAAANRAVVASVLVVLFFNYLFNTAVFGLRLAVP